MVLDLYLRPRLACFHDRALCSDFASHTKTHNVGVGRTTFQKTSFKMIIIFQENRCDHGFEEIEIYCLLHFVGCICMSHISPLRSNRGVRSESGDVQASGIKEKRVRTW